MMPGLGIATLAVNLGLAFGSGLDGCPTRGYSPHSLAASYGSRGAGRPWL
jgi:hypothetical protein